MKQDQSAIGTSLNGYQISDMDRSLMHCGPVLDDLAKAHILISGGTGFIGQWLLALLIHADRRLDLGLSLCVISRDPETFLKRHPDFANLASINWIKADVRNVSLDDCRFTHVIHAATDTSVTADEQPFALSDVIVGGTRNMLEIARRSSARHVLFLSSGAVYGGQGDKTHLIEEDREACDPLDRRSVYAESKRYAEMLCGLYASEHGLSVKIARCFAFVGPGLPLDAHFAIGNFIADAVMGRDIIIKGDGTPERSYLYAADLAVWLLRALVLGQSGRAYHIGSDQALSLSDLARRIGQINTPPTQVEIRGAAQAGGFRSRYVPSIRRAKAELGCEIWTPLDEAIKRTAQWARDNGLPSLKQKDHADG